MGFPRVEDDPTALAVIHVLIVTRSGRCRRVPCDATHVVKPPTTREFER